MAAITVTPASVVASATATVDRTRVAGEALTAGQAVYLKDSDNKYYKADANAASPANRLDGVALNACGTGQPVAVCTQGLLTIGATVVVGTIYVLGATAAGDINPSTDLVTGWYTCILGVATTAGIIDVKINNSGVAVP